MCKCDGPSSGGELRSSFGNCAVEGCTPFQSQLELRSLTRSRINQSIKKLPATQHSLRAVAVCAMNATMRGGAVLILLGITTLAAYSVGRQDAPANEPPVAFAAPTAVARSTAQPVAFTTPAVEQAAPAPLSTPAPQKPATDVPAKPESKRKVEAVLTAAAITALIVQASRNEYYATGHPCACPDDRARNGSACGGRSAYSRPARPLNTFPVHSPKRLTETSFHQS
jgi:hypothetical protein